MKTLGVLLVVYSVRYVLLAAACGTLIAGIAAYRTPPELLYASVSSVAPVALVIGATVLISAALLQLPRTEAGEITAGRRQWHLRFTVSVLLILVASAGVITSCLVLDYWWFFPPLLRGALVITSLTSAAVTMLPKVYVTLPPGAYLLVCFYLSRGENWWDLVLAHPSRWSYLAALTVTVGGLALFVWRGSYPTYSAEDL